MLLIIIYKKLFWLSEKQINNTSIIINLAAHCFGLSRAVPRCTPATIGPVHVKMLYQNILFKLFEFCCYYDLHIYSNNEHFISDHISIIWSMCNLKDWRVLLNNKNQSLYKYYQMLLIIIYKQKFLVFWEANQ